MPSTRYSWPSRSPSPITGRPLSPFSRPETPISRPETGVSGPRDYDPSRNHRNLPNAPLNSSSMTPEYFRRDNDITEAFFSSRYTYYTYY